jgi:hypothetical protein
MFFKEKTKDPAEWYDYLLLQQAPNEFIIYDRKTAKELTRPCERLVIDSLKWLNLLKFAVLINFEQIRLENHLN